MEKIKEIEIGSKGWLDHGQTVSLPKSWAEDVGLGGGSGDKIVVYREGRNLILIPKVNRPVSYTLYRGDADGLFEKLLDLVCLTEKKEVINSVTILNGDISFSEKGKSEG